MRVRSANLALGSLEGQLGDCQEPLRAAGQGRRLLRRPTLACRLSLQMPNLRARLHADCFSLETRYRAEIQRVEEQIKRRVAIGSFVSERKLVDELVR